MLFEQVDDLFEVQVGGVDDDGGAGFEQGCPLNGVAFVATADVGEYVVESDVVIVGLEFLESSAGAQLGGGFDDELEVGVEEDDGALIAPLGHEGA